MSYVITKDEPRSTSLLAEYRCTCGRLLFKAVIRSSSVQIKCRRCGELRTFGREVIDSQRCYSFLVGMEGRLVAASETMADILGYSSEELCALKLDNLCPYQRRTVHQDSTHERVSELPVRMHETHRTKAGESLPVLVHRELVGAPRTLELYQCEVYSADLLIRDAPHPGIVPHELFGEMDAKGRCLYASEGLAQLFGDDVLLAADVSTYLSPEDAIRLQSVLSRSCHTPFTIEAVHLLEKATTFRLHLLPIRHDDGSARGYAFTFERS